MMMNKVLIANRGAIAVRIIRTLKQEGVISVAVYSEIDRSSLFVQMADEAYCIGPNSASDSYLRGDKIVEIALECGAKAIHPGYGFLSESEAFASLVEDAGLIFLGPSAKVIAQLGDKSAAKELAEKCKVPMVPGHGGPLEKESIMNIASQVGYPVVLKPVGGGGGKGMRIVTQESEILEALMRAKSESKAAFGNDHIMVEKYLVGPKHVEIQVCRDRHGSSVHLFERECSVQRRYQKVIEEAPCVALSVDCRDRMTQAAIRLFDASNYVGIGTVEFLLYGEEFYFLEVNTRIQVEHGITEAITGVDLVSWQLKIANGEPLPLQQNEVKITGHAIELRVIAEDPANGFLPSSGRINVFRSPKGTGVRLDTGVGQGDVVSSHYDSLLAKLIVHGASREQAIARLLIAAEEFFISGIPTTIDFASWALTNSDFVDGTYGTDLIEKQFIGDYLSASDEEQEVAAIIAVLQSRSAQRYLTPNWKENQGWSSRLSIETG